MKWHSIKFGEFASIQPPTSLKRGEEYTFIPMEVLEPYKRDVSSNETRIWDGGGGSRFQNGDTIFARITPCLEHGKTAQVQGLEKNVGFGSTEFLVFRAQPEISDPNFIYYLARSAIIREPAIKSMIGASGRQRAQRSVIEEIVVNVPTHLSAQREIASILSTYDDLIENNRQRMALLEEAAKLLYREWFVRFRFPGHENTRVVDGVPEGWKQVSVSEAIQINPKTPLSDEETHWYVEMSDLPTNSMVIQNAVKCEGRSGSKFRNKDTLFARITPCLENGKTAFVNFMTKEEVGRGSTEFIVLRSALVTPEFVYCLSRTYHFREHAIKNMVGTSGRQRVKDDSFEKLRIGIPPRFLINLFSGFVEPIFEQIRVLHLQNQKLKSSRDLLIPRLMNGEIAI